MPEMNGFEVCQRLKADDKLAPIPVLFLSALSETRDKVNAFRAGGVDYITKPFQVEEVRARVETHLQLHRARQVERDLLERTLNGAVKSFGRSGTPYLAHINRDGPGRCAAWWFTCPPNCVCPMRGSMNSPPRCV